MEYDLKEHLDGDVSKITHYRMGKVTLRTRSGLRLTATTGADGIVRIRAFATNVCPRGEDRSIVARSGVTAGWIQTENGRPLSVTRELGELPITVHRGYAPRRVPGSGDEIRVTVPAGSTGSIDLTRYIEDPSGRRLTFTVDPRDIPRGWRVSPNGNGLAVTPPRSGTNDTVIFVTATDTGGRAGDCWTYPVWVSVTSVPTIIRIKSTG